MIIYFIFVKRNTYSFIRRLTSYKCDFIKHTIIKSHLFNMVAYRKEVIA